MRRIVLTLISGVLVFVITLVLTDLFISRKAEQDADMLNEQILDRFCNLLDDDIIITKMSAFSFLAANFHDNEDSLRTHDTSLIVNSNSLPRIWNNAYFYLEEFLQISPYFESAMFVFDESICREFFGLDRAFAPAINQGDTTRHDFSKSHDFMSSANYKRLKEKRESFWSAPTSDSPVAGKMVSLYIPLTLSDGRFLGSFNLCISTNTLMEELRDNLPYGEEHSQMAVYDEHGTLYAACPSEFNTKDSGKRYHTYERKSQSAPWVIRTICETDAIYADAHKVTLFTTLISLVGMLLMFICCFIIFRQVSKDMRQKAAVEEELILAANVQMSILKPTEFRSEGVRLENFLRPAINAGGDLYDYSFKDGILTFIIGDVSGKGISAALFMTQVVSLFRNAVRYTLNPVEIMSQINESIAENNPTVTFCTAIVGNYDGRRLTLCNAGHTSPVLKPYGGEPDFLRLTPNLPLGVMPQFGFKDNEVVLSSRDTLLLYTDGVTEAKSKDDKFYGEERIIEVMSHDDSLSALLTSLEDFTRKATQSDDITVVRLSV